ncbi:hypothetical protein COCMIDRAFT_109641 [Bipolaris oryzae ATCC 44560]|uniref:Uncharacterized protein n=1 Tax=Bipolaris oryzae ATCC 44560 TaxID=930090 RepID=W6YX49_COCMI|nr:uncharacterized protein COCMIDRAFT_109641 [Bipolaris oryzae ATCC 44560]EUC40099.1 hypothetical protein COCMIDRAFT_109641 [Bipolaris oryzae ATCC 44560]
MSSPNNASGTRIIAAKAPRQRTASATPKLTVFQLLATRPWLLRPQSVSEQDLFIIHCRDNLVPGATGPKDWDEVAEEYNNKYREHMKPLAWKTLSKRCGIARKIFMGENEDYAHVLEYPVPDVDAEGESDEDVDMDTQIVAPITTLFTHSMPGFYDPASIPKTDITTIVRAKFHIRNRTTSFVRFHFLNTNEERLVKDNPQCVDTKILIANSPFYARSLHRSANYTIIDVPEQFNARTINVFIQLIAPVRATRLPDHYLWKAQAATPGLYDRFGAIKAEKIDWTVAGLLDLLLFAAILEVDWIVDIVIDRLHFLFVEQKRLSQTPAAVSDSPVSGRLRTSMSAQPAKLHAEDFNGEIVSHLAEILRDMQTLGFIADVMRGLGAKVDEKWISSMSSQVKRVFTLASEEHLFNCSLEEYCKRYHHHPLTARGCYTSYIVHPPSTFIRALYNFATPEELVRHSSGLLPSGASGMSSTELSKLREENSSPEMLEAEKKVLEMESRLEKAKAALRWARDSSGLAKQHAMREAGEASEEMYGPSQL